MKTSVMEVQDMLSVLSVQGVEERIGKVPGVESVTVNFDAGSATVRYDETRLEIADIRSDVRQSGYEVDAVLTGAAGGHEGHTPPKAAPGATVAPTKPSVASIPAPGAPVAAPTSSGPQAPADAASAGDGRKPEPAPVKK